MDKTLCFAITTQTLEAERRRAGGDARKMDLGRVLTLVERQLPQVGPHDVKIEILAVSAEHNVGHAALGDFVDIVEKHGGVMFPGNSAIAQVIETGRDVTAFEEGQIVQVHCNGVQDEYGYPKRIWAFDAPGSIGVYCERTVIPERQLLSVPLDCGLSLWELAALPLRAPTAYHLWRRGLGIFRLKVPRESRARLNVLSFGGGVGELFLMLAQSEGHNAYFCSGNPERLEAMAKRGMIPIDQTEFHRFAEQRDVDAFRERCRQLAGEGMHIVCDMLRGSVFDAGIAVAARQGVNVSAGWQLSQEVTYNSALFSVKQLTADHTHYELISGCRAATELYGSVFRPNIHDEIYGFQDLPRCFQEMHESKHNGIAIVRVAERLPEALGPDLIARTESVAPSQ